MEKEKFPNFKKSEENILLKGPELIKKEKKENETSFSFFFDTKRYYIGYKDGKSFFVIEYFDSLPSGLSEKEKEKFKKEIREEGETQKIVYVLKYGDVPDLKEKKEELDVSRNGEYRISKPRDFERDILDRFIANETNKQFMEEIFLKHSNLSPEKIPQIVEQIFDAYRKKDKETLQSLSSKFSKSVLKKIRNEFREKMLPQPEEIKISQLVDILKNKKVLFYTGAGIGVASGVYDMEQLKEALGIDMSGEQGEIDNFLKKAIINPESVIDSWEKFIKAAFDGPPTPAHQSLGRLAQKLKSQIFTENIDHLQEKTGIKAIHLTGPWLKENIQPEWLKDIDIIVTIGLSYDDRGFLAWYKENNPKGKIVAINLNQPSYLGDEDFLLKGDCQEILPALEKEFIAN
jgi:NAD-dependent SIR2 family protein deacetylase